MKTEDKQKVLTLVTELGYEVQGIQDQPSGMIGPAWEQQPDGTMIKTDVTTITITKQTIFKAQ